MPQWAWAQNNLMVDGYDYEFDETCEVTLDLTAGQRIWVELDASNYGRVNCTPSTIEHINGSNMSVSVDYSYNKPIMVGIPGKYKIKISNVNVNVQAEDIKIWVPDYDTDPETGQDYESGGHYEITDTNYTLKEASATLSITCLSAEEEHQHVYNQEEKNIEGAQIQAETCTEKGIYYKSCICGALGTETFEVNALGHLMVNSGNTIAVHATCTENARKFQTCNRCDYESDTETFESFGTKLGHNYIGGVCQNCGESETQGPIIVTYLSGTSGIGFGEGAASLIDGDDYTKWCSNWYADNKPYIIFKTNVPAKLTDYYMVHGNDTPDYPGRAWATWTIYGANFDSDSQATAESTAWKEVDKHSGYSYGSNYSFSNLTSLQYQYYKIVVDEVPNNSLQQMAEIHFTFFACNHKGTFTEHPAKDPSCTQVGNIAYKECAVCQAIFDMDGNPIDSYEVPMSDHSYDSEGKCTTCGQELPLLSLGSNTIDIEEGYTIFYFIAPQDATYIFETVGDEDTYGAILSTDGETIIAEDDDCGNGQNFRLSYEMSAGSIVTLRVTQYAYKAIPGYTLVIRIHNHEWRDGVCAECHKICDHSDMEDLGHSDATCTQPAGTSYKCNICSFTEFTPDPESSALGHDVVDGVCTRCEKPVAIAVTIGSDTHQFTDFDEALPVALDALSATVTLLTDVTLPKDKDLFFDRGNITLDLNGKKISGNGFRIVYLLGGNLTITDNTADKKGVIENTTNGGDGIPSAVVWVDLGALVIHAGTFCSKSELALYANQHNQEFINVTIDGGRFVSLEGGAAISTVYKSSLAEGYAYYKTGTCEEIEEQLDTPISEYDIIVLPMSIKAHDFTSKTLTAEPDEHGLYAYVCDHGCGAHGDYNVVKDGEAFSTPVAFTTSNVTMAREFTQSTSDAVVPATIMLPFSIEANKLATEEDGVVRGTKFYAFTSLTQNAETGKWEANMDRVTGTIEAYTPYMIVLTEDTAIDFGSNEVTFPKTPESNNDTQQGDWTFVATNEEKVWKEDDFANGEVYYGFAAGNETTPEGKFVKVGAGASIDPLRAYIMKTPQTRAAGTLPSIISVRLNETSVTGIGTLNTETGEFTFDGWYDLQGLPVGGSYRGIVIQDGKKFIMQ